MHFVWDGLISEFVNEQKRTGEKPENLLGKKKYRPLVGHFATVSHEHYRCDCWHKYLDCVRRWNKLNQIPDRT